MQPDHEEIARLVSALVPFEGRVVVTERLLRELDVHQVDIDVVWDPVWTRRRLSQSAREAMRSIGIAV